LVSAVNEKLDRVLPILPRSEMRVRNGRRSINSLSTACQTLHDYL
jgi:hypothetical protein